MDTIGWIAILVSSPIFNSLANRFIFANAARDYWPDIVKVAVISLLIFVAFGRPQLRPMTGFLIILLAFSIGYLFVNQFEETQVWLNFRNSSPNYRWVMADSLVQLIPTALMLIAAFIYGQTLKSLFLTKGDLSAPSAIDLFGANATWTKLTPIFSVLFFAVTGIFLLLRLRVSGSEVWLAKLVPALPYLIMFPVLNSLIEEVRYRNVLLAMGTPVLGTASTLLMTTALFGLSHFVSFLGTSGSGGSWMAGLAYALGAAYIGWINGKSMLETHGTLAAWIMHASADLIIILGYILAT